MDQQNLKELFAPPIGLQPVDNIYGFELYSSQWIVKSFLKAIKRAGRSNKIYPAIKKLVDQKRIMPVYQVNGIKKFFTHKMFGNPEDKAILGFYFMPNKRVYIMIDNNVSILATANNDDIASTTIHECQHLFADMNRSKFMSIFKEELQRYYISVFSRIFELKTMPISEINKIISFIATFEGKGMKNAAQKATGYRKVLGPLKKYSTLDSITFNKRIEDIVMIIQIFVKHFSMFLKVYRDYVQILGPLDRAYRDAFGKRNSHTTPYQELISVSEVICVFSELKSANPKIVKGFKSFS